MKWLYLIEGLVFYGVAIFFMTSEEQCRCYYYLSLAFCCLGCSNCYFEIDELKKEIDRLKK